VPHINLSEECQTSYGGCQFGRTEHEMPYALIRRTKNHTLDISCVE